MMQKIAKKIVLDMMRTAAMSSIIKIDKKYNGYDDIYEVDNTDVVQCFILFDNYNYGCGFYMVYDKRGKKFNINAINPALTEEDLKNGVPRREFLNNLEITNTHPSEFIDLQDELLETISFFTLVRIFEKYGFDYIDDKRVSNGSQTGLRYELSGNGDYQAMIKELKEKANYPEKIIEGGKGTYRWSPEIVRNSVIILD